MKLRSEIWQCVFSVFCIAVGVCIYTDCQLGADSVTVFLDGVNKATGVPISWIDQILSIIIFALAYFVNKERLGLTSIIHTLTIGVMISFAYLFITPLELAKQSFFIKCMFLAFAQICFAFGFALLQKLSSGMASADAFIYGLVEKSGLSYVQVHFGFDLFYFVTGFLLGGVIGVGSIVYVLTSGWLTYQMKKLIDRFMN